MERRAFVTRRDSFNAGHRLFRPEWSAEENYRVFGKCSNPSGHGHNYVIEVTCEGPIDPSTGYVFDMKVLADLVHKRIVEDVDHHNLNTDVEWLAEEVPTTEVLAHTFWDRLQSGLPENLLSCVRVYETDKNWAERRRHA